MRTALPTFLAVLAMAAVAPAAPPIAPADEPALRTALAKPFSELPEGKVTLRELLDLLADRHGVSARLDTAAFKRLGSAANPGPAAAALPRERFLAAAQADGPVDEETAAVLRHYDQAIQLPTARGLTVADVLGEAVAQLPGRCAYRVRGNQILIRPAYIPPVIPGGGANPNEAFAPMVPQHQLLEQIVGEPVSVSVENKSLADAVKELRKLTGANIVLDARCKDQAKEMVDGTFDDARLLNVLSVLADMCDLKAVSANNVFYVTTPENAAKLQKEANRELFGDPWPALPMGVFAEPEKKAKKKPK